MVRGPKRDPVQRPQDARLVLALLCTTVPRDGQAPWPWRGIAGGSPKNVTVEVNVVSHGDGGAPGLNGPLHGIKDG